MWVSSFVNAKTKAWILGQKVEFDWIEKNPVWFHCASLGEYKQAKPMIKLLKDDGFEVVVSFFSPSGFLKVNDDISTCYLPVDTRNNAKTFIKKVNPRLAIFIRSEYWFNYISELQEYNIPLVFINSFLRKQHYLFKWYGKWFLKKLKLASFFYTIDKQTSSLLAQYQIEKQLYIGDTKVDQVISNSYKALNQIIKNSTKKIILAASTEKGDWDVIQTLIESYSQAYLIVIVPHEHSDEIFHSYQKIYPYPLEKYSSWTDANTNVLYVDQFGILPSLFKHAWLSYIGGGFDNGIHNILESCVENKPMIFGKNHKKFPEAEILLRSKSALSIKAPKEINSALKYFESETNYSTAVAGCKSFIRNNKGATQKIYNHMKSHKLLQ